MADVPTSSPLFASVLCGTDNGASGVAARRHAQWLAGLDGSVDQVPTGELTRHGPTALADRCQGHDLLVLASEHDSLPLLRDVPIPVLLARWCPPGQDLTDLILVVAGHRPSAAGAAELAAQIARRHRGTISVVAVPGRSRELERALAAVSRIIVRETGVAPPILGELDPPEVAVPRAAAEADASLLVVGIGPGGWDRQLAHEVARRAGCSVLTVPVPVPISRRSSRDGSVTRTLVPA